MEGRNQTVVALGMFDGMHLGHRALIARAVRLAQEHCATAAAYTFANHPLEVLGRPVRLLSAAGEREALLRACGAEELRMERFTRALADMPPEAFIEKLNAMWALCGIVVGFNYSFGKGGAGTPELLAQAGRRYGYFTEVLGPVEYRGAPVSSTRIRLALEEGDVSSAAEMLARPYALSGKVVANRRIGRRIGFPTANILLADGRALPKDGVYASRARIVGGAGYPAVTNIGTNPTVNGAALSVETHLIGYEGDLYGSRLTVEFLKRLRDEIRFDSVEALKRQIALDTERARLLGGQICSAGL